MGVKYEAELIRLMGWRTWAWFTLRLDKVSDWFQRVYYCHHNARVIADFEDRMAGVLMCATDGRMSKAYYSEETMRTEIYAAFERARDEAYQEGQNDLRDELGIPR